MHLFKTLRKVTTEVLGEAAFDDTVVEEQAIDQSLTKPCLELTMEEDHQ